MTQVEMLNYRVTTASTLATVRPAGVLKCWASRSRIKATKERDIYKGWTTAARFRSGSKPTASITGPAIQAWLSARVMGLDWDRPTFEVIVQWRLAGG